MNGDTYMPLSYYEEQAMLRAAITAPVVQFAGHASGHAAHYDFRLENAHIKLRSAGPSEQARGFWIVYGDAPLRPISWNIRGGEVRS